MFQIVVAVALRGQGRLDVAAGFVEITLELGDETQRRHSARGEVPVANTIATIRGTELP